MGFHHTIIIQRSCCISWVTDSEIRCLILHKISPLWFAILRTLGSKPRLISGECHLLLLAPLKERPCSSSTHAKVLIPTDPNFLDRWVLLKILAHFFLCRHGLLLDWLGGWLSGLRTSLADLVVVVLLLWELVRSTLWDCISHRLLHLHLLFLKGWLALSLVVEVWICWSYLLLYFLLLFWWALISVTFSFLTIGM